MYKSEKQKTQELQKYFASVLRKKSKGEAQAEYIDPSILKFFTRKELIAIINQKFNGKLPKEVNLVELENEDLLQLIGDDLFILSYLVPQWIDQELGAQQKLEEKAQDSDKKSETGAEKQTISSSNKEGEKDKQDNKDGKEKGGK